MLERRSVGHWRQALKGDCGPALLPGYEISGLALPHTSSLPRPKATWPHDHRLDSLKLQITIKLHYISLCMVLRSVSSVHPQVPFIFWDKVPHWPHWQCPLKDTYSPPFHFLFCFKTVLLCSLGCCQCQPLVNNVLTSWMLLTLCFNWLTRCP